MKRKNKVSMRRSIFVFLLACMFVGFANAQTAQEEVMMKMLSLKNALLSKDSVALSNILADDVTYVHSTGNIQTKAQLIRDVVSGTQDYKSIEASGMNVRMYDNASVVTVKLRVNVTSAGKPRDLNMFVTLTWIKMNGDWKLVARQSVKLND